MAAAPQRFPLPNMPFRREVHSGCSIGTSIMLKAQGYQDKVKNFTVQLTTAKDIAILVTVPVAKHGKISASARVDGKFTSEVDKPIFVPAEVKFSLHLRITKFVVEIYYNDNHLLDFVHRVNPMDVKEVHIEGPLIVEEVVFNPPQGASLDSVPSYEQATSMGSDPIREFRHLAIGPPSSSLTPTPAPGTATGSTSVLVPTPGPPQTSQTSSLVVNQPIAGIPLPAGVDALSRAPELPSKRFHSATTSTNPFSASLSGASSSALPAASMYSKPPMYDKPSFTPTPFEQARNYSNLPGGPPYVTSPTPTPSPATTSASSSAMAVLQPTSFQTAPLPSQQSQSIPYPSSSQAMQPYPPMGPVPGMPYPQMMPQPNLPHTAGVNPYQQQQYPLVLPPQPGAAMYPHYSAYQQPYQYAYSPSPYAAGYPQSPYPGYPTVYAPGCHEERTSQEESQPGPQLGSQPNCNINGTSSLTKSALTDNATIQLLTWLEMMNLFVKNLLKNPQGVQMVLEQTSAAEHNFEQIERIRTLLPKFADMVRSPEVRRSLNNPRVVASMRRIELEMEVIKREAPALAEVLRSGHSVREEELLEGASDGTREVTAGEHPTPASVRNSNNLEEDGNEPTLDLVSQMYETEVGRLAAMGFTNKKQSLAAIRASDGNLERAVDHLLNSQSN